MGILTKKEEKEEIQSEAQSFEVIEYSPQEIEIVKSLLKDISPPEDQTHEEAPEDVETKEETKATDEGRFVEPGLIFEDDATEEEGPVKDESLAELDDLLETDEKPEEPKDQAEDIEFIFPEDKEDETPLDMGKEEAPDTGVDFDLAEDVDQKGDTGLDDLLGDDALKEEPSLTETEEEKPTDDFPMDLSLDEEEDIISEKPGESAPDDFALDELTPTEESSDELGDLFAEDSEKKEPTFDDTGLAEKPADDSPMDLSLDEEEDIIGEKTGKSAPDEFGLDELTPSEDSSDELGDLFTEDSEKEEPTFDDTLLDKEESALDGLDNIFAEDSVKKNESKDELEISDFPLDDEHLETPSDLADSSIDDLSMDLVSPEDMLDDSMDLSQSKPDSFAELNTGSGEKDEDRPIEDMSSMEDFSHGLPDLEDLDSEIKVSPAVGLKESAIKDTGDMDLLMEDLQHHDTEKKDEEDEDEALAFSEAELEKIKEVLKSYSFSIRQIIKKIILEELLQRGDMEELVNLVLHQAPEKQIRKFIEKKLKIRIDALTTESGRRVIASKEKYSLSSLQRRQTVIRYTKFVAALFLIGLMLGMLTYRYVYKPMRAKEYFGKGLTEVLKPGNEAIEKPRDYKIAENFFQRGLEYSPEDVKAYNDYALAYMKRKRFDEAYKKLDDARQINRKNDAYDPNTYYNLGIYHIESRRPRKLPDDKSRLYWAEAARDYFKRANRRGNNLLAIEGIGRTYLLENQLQKAESFFQKIVTQDPKNLIGHASLLNLFINLNRTTDVLIEHRRIRELKLENQLEPYLLAKLGGFYLEQKNVRIKYNIQSSEKDSADTLHPIAQDVLFGLAKNHPKFAEGRFQLARFYNDLKQRKKAFRQLEDTLKLDPDHSRAYIMKAEMLLGQNEVNDAYKNLKEAIITYRKKDLVRSNPYMPEENIGKAYSLLGDLFYYHPGKIQRSPSFSDIQEDKVETGNQFSLALKYYDAAAKLGYETPSQSYNFGRALYLEGNYEEALNEWLKIQHKAYDNPHLLYALGNAFYKIGKFDTAKGEYKKLIDDYEYKSNMIETPIIGNSYHGAVFHLLSSAYNNLGAIYERQNMEKESLFNYWQSIEKSRFLEKENLYARLNLSRAFKGKGRIVEPVLDDSLPVHLFPVTERGNKNP
jgi:tetratricopeptide (TPR) repeat protein